TTTVLAGTSILVSFISAGVPLDEIVQLTFDAGVLGAETIRDKMLEAAFEAYGIASEQMLDEKVRVRVYFEEGEGATVAVKNIFAPFDITYGDPACSSSSGDTYTNGIGMEFVRIPAGTF